MSEFYVVSKKELEELRRAAYDAGVTSMSGDCTGFEWCLKEQADTEATCLARPVPEWATHFAELTTSVLSKWERIEK